MGGIDPHEREDGGVPLVLDRDGVEDVDVTDAAGDKILVSAGEEPAKDGLKGCAVWLIEQVPPVFDHVEGGQGRLPRVRSPRGGEFGLGLQREPVEGVRAEGQE